MIDWDRRRSNLRILCAAKDVSATEAANSVGLSPNTLTKFLNAKGERTLSAASLKALIEYFDLTNESDLDTDNILSDPRQGIRKIVDQISTEEATNLLKELHFRFRTDTG